VLYYRDCRAFHKYMVATITADGITVENDLDLKSSTNWEIAHHTG